MLVFHVFILLAVVAVISSATLFVKETATLSPTNYNAYDRFGSEIQVYGKTALVSSIYGSTSTCTQCGVVNEFQLDSSGQWKPVASNTLIPTSTTLASSGTFGNSVHIYGNQAIIGASATNQNDGKAYLFERSVEGGAWKETASFGPTNDLLRGSMFGGSTFMNDKRILIGAPNYSSGTAYNMKSRVGATYIYEKINNSWKQINRIVPNEAIAGSYCGWAIGAYQNYVYVTCQTDSISPTNTGALYIYNVAPGTGRTTKVARFVSPVAAAGDWFGYNLHVPINDPSMVYVGSHLYNGGYLSAYKAVASTSADPTWQYVTTVSAPTTETDGYTMVYFGSAIVAREDVMVVGAFGAKDPSGNDLAGVAVSYDITQMNKLLNSADQNITMFEDVVTFPKALLEFSEEAYLTRVGLRLGLSTDRSAPLLVSADMANYNGQQLSGAVLSYSNI